MKNSDTNEGRCFSSGKDLIITCIMNNRFNVLVLVKCIRGFTLGILPTCLKMNLLQRVFLSHANINFIVTQISF